MSVKYEKGNPTPRNAKYVWKWDVFGLSSLKQENIESSLLEWQFMEYTVVQFVCRLAWASRANNFYNESVFGLTLFTWTMHRCEKRRAKKSNKTDVSSSLKRCERKFPNHGSNKHGSLWQIEHQVRYIEHQVRQIGRQVRYIEHQVRYIRQGELVQPWRGLARLAAMASLHSGQEISLSTSRLRILQEMLDEVRIFRDDLPGLPCHWSQAVVTLKIVAVQNKKSSLIPC